MVEFTGYISGTARKYFVRKTRNFAKKLLIVSTWILLPFIGVLSYGRGDWKMLVIYAALMIILPVLTYIPKSEKEILSLLPKRIYTEDEYIICEADKYEESRNMYDAKLVKDHGEFYEFIFPFGKVSDKFICQKSLLTKGSFGEFEKYFNDKLVRIC